MKDASLKEEYSHYAFRKLLFVLICIFGAFLGFWISVTVGTRSLSPLEVYDLIIKNITNTVPPEDWYDNNIVWNFRVPRALLGILCGASMGIAGAVMQTIMKNPLADAYTTGVSSGALFGVAIAAILGFSVFKGNAMSTSTIGLAFVFAMIPVIFIVAFASFFRKSPSSLILTGVAISYLFNALTTVILVTSGAQTIGEVYHWQVGSLSGMSWAAIPAIGITTVVGILIVMPMSRKLNLMALDDSDAQSLGLKTERLRTLCLILTTVMVAIVICYVGIIGFVGLVIPHIVRLILGSDNRYLIPASAALGAVFLLGCDIITRSLDVVATIPVGVVTGLFGAPIFLYLIVRSRRSVW